MHWLGEFRAALFAEWMSAGLPDPEQHMARYRQELAGARCPLDLPFADGGPLDRAVVDRVYGFGYVVGTAFSSLLGVTGPPARDAADWCARFNLGISLVDYACDESARLDVLASLEPFRSLAGRSGGTRVDPRPEEQVAASLADEVIAELSRSMGEDRARRELAKLYRAEVATAQHTLAIRYDPKNLERDLRVKSAGPFVLMARHVAAAGSVGLGRAGARDEVAADLGAAVGTLFWLADDSQDLWIDLAADAWNLFLLKVAAIDPRVLAAPPGPFRDAAILKVLTEHKVAPTEACAAVDALVKALASGDRKPRDGGNPLGVVGAALAVW